MGWIWDIHGGDGPLVATAIHSGHEVRDRIRRHMLLDDETRLREEDPYTAHWTTVVPTRVVALRSRFEVDLNRPRDKAVYRSPEDAWGLQVWNGTLPADVIETSLAGYDAFYAALRALYSEFEERHGKFVVYDLHSYNHRRGGPQAPPEEAEGNPQVNLGTATIRNRDRWAAVIDRFRRDLAAFDFPGGALDVRENVRFLGGNCARWTHEMFPGSACVLSIELKKFFMDEWTAEPNETVIEAIRQALESTVPGVLEELAKL